MRHDPDAVMIFAAGHGTRMRPLSLDRPKAMVEVAGRPLIDHAIAQARQVTPRKIVVNTHAHAALLDAHLRGQSDVQTIHETILLETGGGLRAALPDLGSGPVFTLNSDAVWAGPSALNALKSHWRAQDMDALLLLVPQERAFGHAGNGSFTLQADGQIASPGPLIYTGAQIVQPAALHDCPDTTFSICWLWQRAAEHRRLYGCLYDGKWADVGTPEGVGIAEKMVDYK